MSRFYAVRTGITSESRARELAEQWAAEDERLGNPTTYRIRWARDGGGWSVEAAK